MSYLQSLEGVCRDEYKPKSDGRFEQITFNVEKFASTDVKELEKKLREGHERPIMLISWPDYLMKMYVSEFSKVIRNYENAFDVYYVSD